jgi:hypothetical protein
MRQRESNKTTTDFTDGTDEDRLATEHFDRQFTDFRRFLFLSVPSVKSVVASVYFGRVERDVSGFCCIHFFRMVTR